MIKEKEQPAFPRTWDANKDTIGDTGLTKREYAAIQCLQGMLAGKVTVVHNANTGQNPQGMADVATQYADALFNRLEKKDSNG